MHSKEMFFEKFKEAAASVLPITLIVALMCLCFVPVTTDLLLAFLLGAVLLMVGMGLFTLGSDVSMTQIGSHMGAKLTKSRKLMRAAKLRMFIDIPGNGIMISVPIKSVGGGRTMAYLTDNKTPTGEKPKMDFSHELIYVILNEGASDMVMHAARSAGATGGTVLLGKGTGSRETGKFLGISLASEKDVVLIVAKADQKAAIMKAIVERAGPGTDAGAICFSLPVPQVAGLRQVDQDDTEDDAEDTQEEA